MAVKKKAPEKKAVTRKKAPAKASAGTPAKKNITKGDSYVCGVCGLTVTIERVGSVSYAETSPVFCCSKAMKKKARKAKVAKK